MVRTRTEDQMFHYIYRLIDGKPDERLGGYFQKAEADKLAARMQQEEDPSATKIKLVVRYERRGG